ncbi:MAG: allantoinase AllB [Gemmatimonadaceae bacterium]
MLGGDELTVIRGRRVITPDGEMPAAIHIAGGVIERVTAYDDIGDAIDVYEAGESVVMPGLVDTHVHANEPGRTEWEGFESVTQAALAGGVTTILDMPLNSVPATTTVEALDAKRNAARGKSVVNVEFIGGVVPGNVDQIEPLAAAGVCAFKCFLTPSGVDEFPHVTEADLSLAFPVLARTGLPLMVHAEDPACLIDGGAASPRYADYLASRPVSAERSAIETLIRLIAECPTRVHIVHLSSASSLDLISDARKRGLHLTVETCPHYLTFAAEDVADGATEYKCAPPIRSRHEQEALWEALLGGRIDFVASDHSPCPPELKETAGDFFAAWGGISSVQLTLPAVWTGARERGAGPTELARWLSSAPAKLAGLGNKGAMAAGFDADIVVWDPNCSFTVDAAKLWHRHPVTPYAGKQLFGVIRDVWVGGQRSD